MCYHRRGHEGGEDVEDAMPEETDDRGAHKDGDHEDMNAKLQEAWGDVSGAAPKEVRRARLKEIQYIKDNKVWRRIPRQEARHRGYKIVNGRWIEHQLEDGLFLHGVKGYGSWRR